MYNRFYELKIGPLLFGTHTEVIEGELIEPMQIGFTIQHTVNQNPNEAEILIYNPSPETQAEIEKEGLEVELRAGYMNKGGEYEGLIFKGVTRRATTKIVGGKDKVTTIWAGDADDAYKYTKANVTLPAGANDPQAIVDEATKLLEANGVEIGEVRIEGPPDDRATVLDRPIRLELDDLCRRYKCHWTIHHNIFQLWPKEEPIDPTPVMLLSSEYGLIDAPEPTEAGVRIRTLLIHELHPGFLFELEATPSIGKDRLLDGLYRIDTVTFSGESSEGYWVADIEARKFEGVVQQSRNTFADSGGQ